MNSLMTFSHSSTISHELIGGSCDFKFFGRIVFFEVVKHLTLVFQVNFLYFSFLNSYLIPYFSLQWHQMGRRIFDFDTWTKIAWNWNYEVFLSEHGEGARKQYQLCDPIFLAQSWSYDCVLYHHLHDDRLGQVQACSR